ncbi:hypothetical protein TYRP_001969 [Tyrophagus putrescentiae]|nr:hypothetical protein TYRP_001969 [Tyrophagus putrescentiae]
MKATIWQWHYFITACDSTTLQEPLPLLASTTGALTNDSDRVSRNNSLEQEQKEQNKENQP